MSDREEIKSATASSEKAEGKERDKNVASEVTNIDIRQLKKG